MDTLSAGSAFIVTFAVAFAIALEIALATNTSLAKCSRNATPPQPMRDWPRERPLRDRALHSTPLPPALFSPDLHAQRREVSLWHFHPYLIEHSSHSFLFKVQRTFMRNHTLQFRICQLPVCIHYLCFNCRHPPFKGDTCIVIHLLFKTAFQETLHSP
ncbi:MAG: hypothetical protein Greene041679_630 [Parcubacteria group bacterium Greene0416_79]|nr:MAG: hypothetical protein Greene041679_630 [Parcubacteria group bacterium Greene0416_79]